MSEATYPIRPSRWARKSRWPARFCEPIFLPIAVHYGMDPVQFGMVMLINCALGLNTPPVGTTQFVGCAIGGISVGEVMRTILPFYAALIAALLLVTYVPGFSMWLPHLLGAR